MIAHYSFLVILLYVACLNSVSWLSKKSIIYEKGILTR